VRTPWFPPSIKPERHGVYERLTIRKLIFYSYWNGQFWGGLGVTAYQAYTVKNHKSKWQYFYWRGLSSDPHYRGV
jgi:hypothetical protein